MKLKAFSLLSLAFLVACAPITSTPTITEPTPTVQTGYPPIASATAVVPTGYPAPATETTVPPTEIALPTETAAPAEVWEIWFIGFSCEGVSLCGGPGIEPKYYSIKSDGSSLREIDTFEFYPKIILPPGSPKLVPPIGMASLPQYSPKKSQLLYLDVDLKLIILDLTTNEVTPLYDALQFPSRIGPYCWASDRNRILFFESRKARAFTAPTLYAIDTNGNHLEALFTFPGFEGFSAGACSPSNTEVVISISDTPQISGLYIVDLSSGATRQILSSYIADVIMSVITQ